jgi:hypothetical protein
MICEYTLRDGILWVIFPENLTGELVRGMPGEFDAMEDKFGMPPCRVVDMRSVKIFHADFLAMEDFTSRRKKRQFPGPIKSAIIAQDDLHIGYARMYQNFIDHPQITVEVFRDEVAAIAWLKSATPPEQSPR